MSESFGERLRRALFGPPPPPRPEPPPLPPREPFVPKPRTEPEPPMGPHPVLRADCHGRSFEIQTKLLDRRVIALTGDIDDTTANVVAAQLVHLHLEDPTKDIHLYVDSPGGSVTASLAIYDTMQFVKCDVATYAVGQAAGTGLLLLVAGERGKRFALPHARMSFADIWGGEQATASDIEIQQDEIARLRKAIFEIYVQHTGQGLEGLKVAHGTGIEYGPKEAVDLGFVDAVIKELPETG